MNSVPLVQKTIKKQANPLILGILGVLGLAGIGSGVLSAIRGVQSNIAEDSRDLAGAISGLVGKYPQSEQIVDEMLQSAQQLEMISDQMLAVSGQGTGGQAEAMDFNAKIGQANMLVGMIEQHFEILKSRESIMFAPSISGKIADVKDGLNDFAEALMKAGESLQRSETAPAQSRPGSPMQDVPLSTPRAPLSDEDKQKVVDFLNKNFKQGTTVKNLDEVLASVLEKASNFLGIKNLTFDMLKSANIDQIRQLFAVWRNPAAFLKNYDVSTN